MSRLDKTKVAHGYVRYTHGCRCDVCRAAKAAYMRAARSAQRVRRANAGWFGYVSPDVVTHGLSGYQTYQCRCPACVEAKRAADRRRQYANRRSS